jgi:hypothetical protein
MGMSTVLSFVSVILADVNVGEVGAENTVTLSFRSTDTAFSPVRLSLYVYMLHGLFKLKVWQRKKLGIQKLYKINSPYFISMLRFILILLGALPFFVSFSSTLAQEETEAASEKNMPTGYVDAALYDKSNRLIIMDDAGFVDVSTLPSDDISIGVNIDLELWEEVKKAAIDENITVTEFLEEALRDRLAKAEAGE